MSNNVVPIPVSGCLDPRLEIRDHEYISMRGAAVSSYVTFPANNLSQSNIAVTCNPPSREMAISRLVFQRAQFTITISGTNATAGPLLTPGRVGPRAYPLTMVTDAMQITLNNVVATQSPLQQYWGALMWLGDNDHANRFGQYSMCPSMLDQTQSYAESFATNRSPLTPYVDNSYENTRSGFVGFQITSNPNGGTTATIQLNVVQPILVSPFVAGHSSNFTSCISGIQNASVQLNLGDLRRLLSIDNTEPGIVIDVNQINTTVDNYSLIFNYFTVDPLMSIPRNISASYFNLTPYATAIQAPVLAGGSISIPFNSIQLSNIPRRLIIWARECDRDRSVFTSDTFLSLPKYTNPLSVTYDNNQFLSQATTEDLYNMAVKNGCQMSYTQYTKEVGSLIVLDAGIDFGLSPQDAPGVLKNVQLGLTCNFVNTSDRTLNVQMFVLAVYEGVFNVIDGNSSLILAPLSADDVLNARRMPGVTYEQQASVYGGGGNLFRSLGNAFKSAHKFVKDNRLVSTALGAFPHPAAQSASQIARQLGYGAGRSGGRMPRRRNMRGGNLDVEGGNLNDSNEDECEIQFEYEEPIKQAPKKVNILNRLRSKKIIKASDLAEDY